LYNGSLIVQTTPLCPGKARGARVGKVRKLSKLQTPVPLAGLRKSSVG